MPANRPVFRFLKDVEPHWVGDGFPVRTLFAYNEFGREASPFLLLDYAGPAEFPATDERRGVGEHPHRGFETVTIVYAGEVEHRDSSGGGGVIGPGDVQWMTAAAGLVHEEFHGPDFAKRGGRFEMIQLWVNLPAAKKMSPPRYQHLANEDIPKTSLPDDAGTARVIAGEFAGVTGPAETFTPIQVVDLQLHGGRSIEIPVPNGHSAVLVGLDGRIQLGDAGSIEAGTAVIFESAGDAIALRTESDAKALLLTGEKIDEPIAGRGPFVMNTADEIQQAMADFRDGKMGRLA